MGSIIMDSKGNWKLQPSGAKPTGDSTPVRYDPINHPSYYTFGKYEVLDVIEDWGLGFHLGNVVKYVARAGRKGDAVEDLKKARTYLDRYIKLNEAK